MIWDMSQPAETVKALLKERGLTQAQFAEQLGTTQPALSRTLGSPIVNPQSQWLAILEALGLEVVVQPKRR